MLLICLLHGRIDGELAILAFHVADSPVHLSFDLFNLFVLDGSAVCHSRGEYVKPDAAAHDQLRSHQFDVLVAEVLPGYAEQSERASYKSS